MFLGRRPWQEYVSGIVVEAYLDELVVPVPGTTSFVEACTMVTVFMTVDVAMCHAATLPSDRAQPVLVHSRRRRHWLGSLSSDPCPWWRDVGHSR